MKQTTISSQTAAGIVTTSTNTPGVATPIFTVLVPDGAAYTLPNMNVINGAAVNGALIVADLRNAAGDRLRVGSLLVGYRAPAAEFVTQQRAIPLTTWADLSTAQQRNAQYRATIAQSCDLNVGPYLKLKKAAKLVFSLECAEAVDWSKSYVEIVVDEENGA